MLSLLRILLLLLASACVSGDASGPPPVTVEAPLIVIDAGDRPTVAVGDAVFDVELAYTRDARTRGLSGRDSLSDSAGMLFVFESGRTSDFWMKDMKIPLDFVWIGDGCTVVDLHSDVPPPPASSGDGSLEVLSSGSSARYTLEVNGGKVAELGVTVGDRVRFGGLSGRGVVC